MKTKPFDLHAAMSGAKLVTRDGRDAKFIAYVPETDPGGRVLVLIDKTVWGLYDNGKFRKRGASNVDLFLAVQTRSINGHEYPEPEMVAPEKRTKCWFPSPANTELVYDFYWDDVDRQKIRLRRGLVHLTREAAEEHARAIILAGGGEV